MVFLLRERPAGSASILFLPPLWTTASCSVSIIILAATMTGLRPRRPCGLETNLMSIIYEDQETKELRAVHVAPGVPEDLVLQRDIPRGSRVCDADTLDIDPEYFTAYRLSADGKIQFFSELGKEIQKNKWRIARKPLLEKLDIETMKSIMDPVALTKVEKEKQALRDVTKTAMPNNLDGIKNTWPEILGPRP